MPTYGWVMNPCQPGDITVTPVERGFMLRRVTRPPQEGGWWHYIGTLDNREIAVRLAQKFAKAGRVRAWLHKTEGTYLDITAATAEDPG